MANNIYTSIARNSNLINRRNRRTFVPEENLFPDGGLFNTNLSSPQMAPYVNWSDPIQRKIATTMTKGIIDTFTMGNNDVAGNFGKGPMFQNNSIFKSTSGPSVLSSDASSFFNSNATGATSSGATTSVSVKPTTMQAFGMASNFLDAIPTGDKRGMWDTLDPVYHLAGGRESGAGNVMSDAGVSLTKAGLLSGLPYMALAGAALKVIGGLTNAAFGIKEDKVKKAIADLSINTNSNFVSNANSFDDIKGPASMAATNIYEGGWFSGGKADDKNKEMAENMLTAYSWADRSVANNISNITNDLISAALQNYAAFGGPIDVDPSTAIGYSIYTDKYMKNKLKANSGMTNMFAGTPDIFGFGGGIYTKGANFDTGVSFINKGGTHEENPNDGVQMGVDSQGVPNLVEEGEVRWDDYIFSDRLIVPRGKRGNYGKRARKYAEGGKLAKGKGTDTPYESKVLKPFEGLTFADAAKKILKRNGADERDDAITMRGIDAELSVLAGIQEKEREKEKLREMQETIDNMSPEEFAMLQQQMEAQQAALQQQEMAMQQLQMIPEGMELLRPLEEQQPIAALGGILNTPDNMYPDGGELNLESFKKDLEKNGLTLEDYYIAAKGYTEGSTEEQLARFMFKQDPSILINEENFDSQLAQQYLDSFYKNKVGESLAKVLASLGLSVDDWNNLSNKDQEEYIRKYRKTLRKEEKATFDKKLSDYKTQQELKGKVDEYQKQQRESTLNANDISNLSYDNKLRLAKYMNPNYQALDLSKLSLNEREEAIKTLDDLLIQMSKDKGITLDTLNKNFAAPEYHKDWKPVDAEKAWVNNGYNWDNPIYGEPSPVPVELGNTEGHWQPRDWTILDEGEYKGKIKVGDNYYDSMKDYELSDAYLNPRYALAASAAAKDEEGRKLWNDYVSGRLDPKYAGSYDPKLVFGDDFANNVGSEEEFKSYIRSNYDTLHTKDKNGHRSGFFDLIAGQMHGTYNPIRNRELYQMSDDIGNYLAPEGNWLDYYTDSVTDDNKGTILHTLTPREGIAFTRVNGTPEDIEVKPDGTYVVKGSEKNDPFPRAASWPYAIAAGLQLGSLGYNILNPADYSNADALIKAALNAGNYKPIEFRPIGDYLPYKPLDIWYEQNRLNANARATDRAIMNSGINQGARNAALLANAYNNQIASGNLFRLALEYNDALRKQVGEFNKDTNKFNSEGFLKADMANQDAASRAAGYSLEGKRAAYAMRQAIDDAKANAISAGISGLGNLAMAYGQNKWNQDVLEWKLKHNQYPISLLEGDKYKLDPEWEVKDGYLVKRAKGGKLKRRHKGLGF